MTAPSFSFRPLAQDDLPLLREWLARPHLLEWWGPEPTLEEVRDKYRPRIDGDEAARPFIASVNGESVGYIQWYRANAVPGWWPDDPGPGVLGIDQFLADGNRLGQGLGTAMVSQFVALLFEDPSVTEIRLDPHPDNLRAVRCYEKVGFQEVREISTPDGRGLMMRLFRPGRSAPAPP